MPSNSKFSQKLTDLQIQFEAAFTTLEPIADLLESVRATNLRDSTINEIGAKIHGEAKSIDEAFAGVYGLACLALRAIEGGENGKA